MKKERSFFAKQLKKLLIEKNLTQEDLGEKIKVNRQMISRWVSGGRNPSLKSLSKIAKVLDVSVNYFIEDENKSNEYKKCEKDNINININLIMNIIEKQNEIIKNMDKNFENYINKFENDIFLVKQEIEFLKNK